MRGVILIGVFALFILSSSCINPQDYLASPAIPRLQSDENRIDSFAQECRANMRIIASACVIYFAEYGTYPGKLSDLGKPYSLMTCPDCGLPYELKSYETSFTIACPMPSESSHGYIINGVASWFGESECQSNMLLIANETTAFYEDCGRYPFDLEEIGMENLQCPSGSAPYVYVSSSFESGVYISCALPSYSNHGYILDGVPSWTPEYTLEYFCRENMRVIASQAIIFYATNDRYPYNLEEMGLENLVCLSCGDSYIYYAYESVPGYPASACFVECPLLSEPSHGYIDNGVASWFYSRNTPMPE